MIADKIGLVCLHLGGGRETLDSVIDPAVGIVLQKKVGDRVELSVNHETLVTQPPLHPIAPFIRALSYSPITISPTETRKFLKHLARHHCWSLRLHSSRSVLRGRCARALPCKTKRTASGTRCVFHAAPARGAKVRLRRRLRRRVLRRKSAPLPPGFRV